MNEYEALLGLGVTDDEKMRMLANQLRGRQDAGDFLSLSTIPQASALGKSWQQTAANQATQAANQRTGGLNRARQAELDAENLRFKNLQEQRAAQTHSMNMAKPTNFGTYTNATDNTPRTGGMVYNPESGQYEWQFDPNLDQQTPYNRPYSSRSGAGGSGGGKQWYKTEVNGVQGSAMYGVPDSFVPATAASTEELNTLSQAEIDYATNKQQSIAEGKEYGKGEAEWVNSMIDQGYAAADAKRSVIAPLNKVIASIDEGARTGRVWSTLPTFTDATTAYEEAISELTLNNLAQYKLTPVSDKDIAVLREAAFGDYTGERAKQYAQHKIEAFSLLAKADEAVADYLNTIRRRPNAADRAEMKRIVDGIVGDFDFTFRGEKDAKGGEAPKSTQWSEEDIAYTMEKHGLTREEVLQRLGQ